MMAIEKGPTTWIRALGQTFPLLGDGALARPHMSKIRPRRFGSSEKG